MNSEEKKAQSIDLLTQKRVLKKALKEQLKKSELLEKEKEELNKAIKQFEVDITTIVRIN